MSWRYADGFLSPAKWLGAGDNRKRGLRLPFASAKTGKMPAGGPDEWELNNFDQPLGVNRKTADLAKGMQRNIGLNQRGLRA